MGLPISHMKIELALVVSNTFIPNHLFIMNKKGSLQVASVFTASQLT